MCGIVGAVRRRGPVGLELVTRMANRLRHRGPDGDGFLIDGSVGLGHRRLSVIDLESGDQPIFNETGSVGIVCNGEIYNYRELRAALVSKGHTFATASDTEVIVHLYEDHGVDCLQRLNGMFAFAIWDKDEQRLFIARDRLGEKPVYYTDSVGGFAFASELKALREIPDFDATLDLGAVHDYLSYGYIPAPRSVYRSVRKLPAAHYMVLQRGGLEVRRYWRVAHDSRHEGLSPDSATAALEDLLVDSIDLRLRSDVPVGAFLSGGIDSSLTVALASQLYAGSLTTFDQTPRLVPPSISVTRC